MGVFVNTKPKTKTKHFEKFQKWMCPKKSILDKGKKE